MTTRARLATSLSETSSGTSAISSGRSPSVASTPARCSRTPSSLAWLRPARAQRSPSGESRARYSAVRRPVKPVAPKRTRSSSRSEEESERGASVMSSMVPAREAPGEPHGRCVRQMIMPAPTASTAPTALRRTVATVTALAAATTAFAAGFLVADGRGGGHPSYRLTAAGLDTGLSCDLLREWYVGHGGDQVTAWGWQGPAIRMLAGAEAQSAQDSAAPTPSAPLQTQTGSSTGTNVQEVGVDEPDIAKSSGDLLVRISGGSLKTDDVGGSVPRRLGIAPLDRIGDPQLLLSGDRAVVIGAEIADPAAGAPLSPPPARTWVRTYDLSDPSDP